MPPGGRTKRKKSAPAQAVDGAGASQPVDGSGSAAAATPAPQSRQRIVWQRHTDVLPLVFGADADVKHNEHVDDDEDELAHADSVRADSQQEEHAVSGVAVHPKRDVESDLDHLRAVANEDGLGADHISLGDAAFEDMMADANESFCQLAEAVSQSDERSVLLETAASNVTKSFTDDGDLLAALSVDAVLVPMSTSPCF